MTSLLVRVPTFSPHVDPDVLPRLMVRLVDHTSAATVASAPLVLQHRSTQAGDRMYLGATVSLPGANPADMRADVFDVLSAVPAARTDTDCGLGAARRALVFLAEWRRLVALARLPTATVRPAHLLRDLARRLEPDAGPADQPLFPGGPATVDLRRLAGMGDETLLSQLRTDRGAVGPAMSALARGSAQLLAAELVAAHTDLGEERRSAVLDRPPSSHP
jgi:hypothetical protein